MFEELNNDELMKIDGGVAPLACFVAGITVGGWFGWFMKTYW